jgi:hypothetical protein
LVRLIAVLLGTLMPAGLGAIFVWSTLNLVFHGDASLGRILLAVAVLAGVFGLLYVAYRYVNQFEDQS